MYNVQMSTLFEMGSGEENLGQFSESVMLRYCFGAVPSHVGQIPTIAKVKHERTHGPQQYWIRNRKTLPEPSRT
jgi:hypothetical protein